MRAWLIENAHTYNYESPVGFHLLTDPEGEPIGEKLQGLSKVMESLSKKAYNRLPSDTLIKSIQCFLPTKLIALTSIDRLVCENKVVQPTWGSEYEINVRFSERLSGGDERVNRWRSKGKVFREKLKEQSNLILSPLDNSNPKRLYLSLLEANGACLKVPMWESKSEQIMLILLETGIPLALWLRQKPEGLDCCATALDNIICQCNLEKLPHHIKVSRRQAWEEESDTHIGNHLSLLWDDFNLVPPAQQLEMPKP
ncbi:hypothetical protein [Limnoraphis robusta]|uniref:VMAP-C domain-containing protein n=1 Tax=Limnoraphis robusta TaxID=1118279 RepID=UPI00247A091B|nr:hypothetical protein [Limnoraphis robusta]